MSLIDSGYEKPKKHEVKPPSHLGESLSRTLVGRRGEGLKKPELNANKFNLHNT